jgi:hypothetical protein
MPSPESVFEELEADRFQRESEIRLLENIISRTADIDERDALRRSLVLVTYAHLEGYCKFALIAYASAINSLNLPCREAVFPLVASSLSKAFSALRDVNSKHPSFRAPLPDDRELHLLWRERQFVENFTAMLDTLVKIPDKLIDTKSNLSTVVLKRNLYQLGLDHTLVEPHAGIINELLNRRNAIAHGDRGTIPEASDALRFVSSAFSTMAFIQREIYSTLSTEAYRRRSAGEAA